MLDLLFLIAVILVVLATSSVSVLLESVRWVIVLTLAFRGAYWNKGRSSIWDRRVCALHS